MSTPLEELIEDIGSLGISVLGGPPVNLDEPLAQHLLNLGYRKQRTTATNPKDEEHLFLSQLRKHPGNDAEVRLYVDGKLVCGTWPYQITESIDAMVEGRDV